MSRIDKVKRTKIVHTSTERVMPQNSKKYFWYFFSIATIGIASYLLLFSKVFRITKIEVNGYSNPEVISEIVGEKVHGSLLSGNIFLFQSGDLSETLKGDTRLNNIKIIKNYPNKIIINVTELTPRLIWSSAGDNFLLDDRGVVIGKKINEKLTSVYDASNITVKEGERVASPTFIKFINDISEGFPGATGSKIAKITIFDLLTDVHILSTDGWTVYFNASLNSESQLKNLSRVLTEAKKGAKRLEYIDMRLDDRIFYK